MTNKTPHPNADIIYQWSQDTTKKISRRNSGRAEEKWLSFDPYTSGWHTSYIYRFDKDPHPHAALLAEAALDLSRLIQIYDETYERWISADILCITEDLDGVENFRFADTTPQRHKIVSSLTDEELDLITVGNFRTYRDHRREQVNAAAQRAIEDLAVPEDDWFYGWADKKSMKVAIGKYIEWLKVGKL